jgi:hypothetical protein
VAAPVPNSRRSLGARNALLAGLKGQAHRCEATRNIETGAALDWGRGRRQCAGGWLQRYGLAAASQYRERRCCTNTLGAGALPVSVKGLQATLPRRSNPPLTERPALAEGQGAGTIASTLLRVYLPDVGLPLYIGKERRASSLRPDPFRGASEPELHTDPQLPCRLSPG